MKHRNYNIGYTICWELQKQKRLWNKTWYYYSTSLKISSCSVFRIDINANISDFYVNTIAVVDGTFYTDCCNTPVRFPFRNATNCMNKRLLLLSLSVGCRDWKDFKTSIALVKYQFEPIRYLLLKVFSFVMASNTTTPMLDQFCTCSSSLPWKYLWVKQDTTKPISISLCE